MRFCHRTIGFFADKIVLMTTSRDLWQVGHAKHLAAAGCLTYGTNVKEVATQVAEGAVDCGVIYKTDAVTAGLTCVDEAGEDMCGRVVYPAAVVSATEHKELAQEFLTFCASATAAAEFERIGFTPLQAS